VSGAASQQGSESARQRREPSKGGSAVNAGRLLQRAFFEAPPERVAPRLLGKLLVHRTRAGVLAGRIVEVEAYLGPHNELPDPAAHSHRGPTPRNLVLFGPAGHAYVYAIYGRYYCMNITCEKTGRAGCLLLRALEPVAGLELMARNRGLAASAKREAGNGTIPPFSSAMADEKGWGNLCDLTGGPSRLCQALDLTRAAHNGLDLLDPDSPLQVLDDGAHVRQVMVTRRIGIRHAVELPLRFAVPENRCVSGPKSLTGTCIFLRAKSVHQVKPIHKS
jgi:DNA-3-methyladenine glycosylase